MGRQTGARSLYSFRAEVGHRSATPPHAALLGKRKKRRRRPMKVNRWARTPQRVGRGWFVVFVAAGIVVLGGLRAWGPALKYAITQHPYFAVQKIVVDSDGRLSQADIQHWSKIRTGMSVFEIDPWQVEADLLTQPWVASAVVKRDLPNTIHIQVQARRPIAIVRGTPSVYLDQQGTSFFDPSEQTEEARRDLPYISGVAELRLDTPQARQVLAGAQQLLSLAQLWQGHGRNHGRDEGRDQVSEIHWDEQQGYTLFLSHRQATIRVGWHTIPEKFVHIGRVLETWPEDGPAAVFDARFADQVVVRPVSQERLQQTQARHRSAKGEKGYV